MNVRSKIYDRLSEYYYEYYRITGIYMDDSTIRRIIMCEIGGCINGDEVMEYYSTDRKYKFRIYRTESNPKSYYNIYRITIEVYDGIIGCPIMKMSFDEYTCIDILFNAAVSMDLLTEIQDSNAIYINPDTSNLNGYMITITGIFGSNPIENFDKNSPMNYMDRNNKIYDKDIRLDIYERSYIYDNLTPMVSMDMTWEELSEFCFHVFFATIIDLDFPEEYADKLEQIEMFVSNYGLYRVIKTPNTV